ncbi:MAG: HDOD domain-containing protein [Candidatus Calescibacterium sp.]|nr:HDOD domain-containing protein [Candidatus Calescibacterium sp.]MDW8087168.1 HDOD domain-containing protein [Candidatus Calescibacterium sp.]
MDSRITDKEIRNAIERVPPLSSVILKALEKIRNPAVSAKHVADEIAKDPIISLDVLKIANSPIYGFSRRISSLEHAVSLLGFKAIESILLSAYSKNVYNVELKNFKIKRGELSLQSFIGAYVAKSVSKNFFPNVEEISFTAAVMRNLGKISMDYLMSKYIDRIKAEVMYEKDFQKVEKKVIGFTSTELTLIILEMWKVPEDIKFVVSKFNKLGIIKDKNSDLYKSCVCVHVGDRIAQITGIGAGIDTLSYEIDQEIFKTTKIKPEDIEEFVQEAVEIYPKLEIELKETLI